MINPLLFIVPIVAVLAIAAWCGRRQWMQWRRRYFHPKGAWDTSAIDTEWPMIYAFGSYEFASRSDAPRIIGGHATINGVRLNIALQAGRELDLLIERLIGGMICEGSGHETHRMSASGPGPHVHYSDIPETVRPYSSDINWAMTLVHHTKRKATLVIHSEYRDIVEVSTEEFRQNVITTTQHDLPLAICRILIPYMDEL